MLTVVLTAQNWQAFAYGGSHHETVRRTESILVRLSQSELLEVQSQLTNVIRFVNGYLAGIGIILAEEEGKN